MACLSENDLDYLVDYFQSDVPDEVLDRILPLYADTATAVPCPPRHHSTFQPARAAKSLASKYHNA